MKTAIVYWSGTGNTEAMAAAVAEGARAQGAEAVMLTAGEFSAGMLSDYGTIAFGCPAMGAEELEEEEFEPMFAACEPGLAGRRIALFGSYGWGDGEWMRAWEKRCVHDGATLIADGVITSGTPDDEATEACRALGAQLAE